MKRGLRDLFALESAFSKSFSMNGSVCVRVAAPSIDETAATTMSPKTNGNAVRAMFPTPSIDYGQVPALFRAPSPH